MAYLTKDVSLSAFFSRGGGRVVPAGAEESEMDVLVVQAQLGNQRAFEMLYERYYDQICRYLIRIVGDDGIGCELTQEVFLKVWSALPGLRSPALFLSWLYRIATNCAYSHQKKYAKRQQEIPLQDSLHELEQLYVEGPERKIEEAELLRLALAQVSLTYRPCLILYIIEDLPQRKIAELLGMKETCVGKYVSRGIEELRRIYRSFEGPSSAMSAGRKHK